jgi:hypothetical protein
MRSQNSTMSRRCAAAACSTTHASMSARRWCCAFDLRDFFGSVHAGRVQAMFATLGYSRSVADWTR